MEEREVAIRRLRSDLDAWDGRPVFAYGFEDLTGAEWGLLEALSARAEVTVSLPYEPGRAAFASLRRIQEDLAALAAGRIEELPSRSTESGQPALAHLERHLFADDPPPAPALDGAIRFFEAAGARGTLELVAEEIRELAGAGTPLDEIAIVVPSLERWRAPLETVLGTLRIPFSLEGRARLGQTAYGQALLALLRFEWQQAGRRELYAYLRSPFSGFARSNVDFLEGRLRGRGVSGRDTVEEETIKLRDGQPLPPLEALRSATGPVEAVRALAAATSTPTRSSRRSSTRRFGSAPPASAGRSRFSTSPGLARGASMPFSCSGSRRGRFPGAATLRRSSTRTPAARSNGRHERDSYARTPSSASATSSTPPAREPRDG